MNRKKTKKIKKPKKITCVDCGRKTDDYYMSSINSGQIGRCVKCHEVWVLRSTRYDVRFADVEEK